MTDVLALTVDGWSRAETGKHIVFVCTTKTDTTRWEIRRRYREFRALLGDVKRGSKGKLTIPFPEKKLGVLSTHTLESRRVLLQSFLERVLGLHLANKLSDKTSHRFLVFIGHSFLGYSAEIEEKSEEEAASSMHERSASYSHMLDVWSEHKVKRERRAPSLPNVTSSRNQTAATAATTATDTSVSPLLSSLQAEIAMCIIQIQHQQVKLDTR
jgi:hypothetical protein